MKACVLTAPAEVSTRPLVLRELASPPLTADEVRIRISACGICRTDLHVVEGELPVRRSPVIPGHQVVGRGVDTAMYLGFLMIFYLVFRLFGKLEDLDRQLTRIVRANAIKDAEAQLSASDSGKPST